MISKKKQELINSILAMVPASKTEEISAKLKVKEVIYKLSVDATKMKLSCRKCGHVSELPSTSEVVCPHCGNAEKKEYRVARYEDEMNSDYEGYNLSNDTLITTEKCIVNIVGLYEKQLFVLQLEGVIDRYFLREDISYEIFALTVFDENDRPTFFQKTELDEWTNKQPTRHWYHNQMKEKIFLSNDAEDAYLDNLVIRDFRNGYYEKNECSRDFQNYINNSYKTLIGYGKISAPEKKSSRNKVIKQCPEFERMPAFVVANSMIEKFVILQTKKEGMIIKVHCPHCGTDSIFPESKYLDKCPHCGSINLNTKRSYDSSKRKSFIIIDKTEEGILLSIAKFTASAKEGCPDIFYSLEYKESLYITEEKVYVFDAHGDETLISKVSIEFSGALQRDVNPNEAIINNTELTMEEIMHYGILKYSGLYEFVSTISDFDVNREFALVKMWFKNINYHCLYEKSKVIELFSKCGMSEFVKGLCEKVTYPAFINKKATTVQAALSIDNNHFTQIRENNLNLLHTERFINIISIDNLVNYEDVETYIGHYCYDSFLEYLEVNVPYFGTSIKKRLRYLTSLDEYQCIGWTEAIRIWIDYINMCKKLKCDLSDRDVVCTNSLKLEHDRAVKKFNALKDQEVAENFIEAVNKYKDYEYTNEEYGFFVKVPDSQEELYEEGRKLNHCVGSYVDRITRGDAIILFIRKISDPSKPLATAEIRGVKMYQCRAKYNSSPMGIPNMKNFLKEWAKEKAISMKNLNIGY